MRLTLIIASLNAGGAQRVLCELANYWSGKGHHVSLITLDPPNSSSFYDLDPRIIQINLNQKTRYIFVVNRVFCIIKRLFFLRKTIRQLKPDRIISFVDITNITTLIASRGLKIPVIVSERTHPAYYQIPKLYQKLRSFFYPAASVVVVQTKSVATYFNPMQNIQVIPNSVTKPHQIKQNYSDRVQQIVSIGRLCPFKGFDTLIHSFANLVVYYPKLSLTIYGEGVERLNLERLIKNLDLEKKIYLPGTTTFVQEVLMKADLFVFPSHYEGFPNALSEAMAIGLPVIASRCSGNVDVVRDGIDGRFFPIGDVERLTTIALELISDPVQRQALGMAASKISARFNTECILSQWDQVIHQSARIMS